MLQHLGDGDAPLDIAIEHQPNQVKILFRHDVRYSQVVVHDLVDGVEGILFIDDCVEEDAECPDVLLLATIRQTTENFGRGVICEVDVRRSLTRSSDPESALFKRC